MAIFEKLTIIFLEFSFYANELKFSCILNIELHDEELSRAQKLEICSHLCFAYFGVCFICLNH